jgi:hypothetical protein
VTHRRGLRALVGIAAASVFALLLASGAASAHKFSFSNKTFRIMWSSLEITPGQVRCPITLEGSFHSATIPKVFERLIGHVTRAISNSEACIEGRVTFLQEALPWHVTYSDFLDTLPLIRKIGVSLIRAAFQFESESVAFPCLTTSTAAHRIAGIFEIPIPESHSITVYRLNETFGIPLTGMCALLGSAFLRGSGEVRVLGRVTSTISVFLI